MADKKAPLQPVAVAAPVSTVAGGIVAKLALALFAHYAYGGDFTQAVVSKQVAQIPTDFSNAVVGVAALVVGVAVAWKVNHPYGSADHAAVDGGSHASTDDQSQEVHPPDSEAGSNVTVTPHSDGSFGWTAQYGDPATGTDISTPVSEPLPDDTDDGTTDQPDTDSEQKAA